MIIADAYDRAAIYGRDRNITSNANQLAWGGFDNGRSRLFPASSGSYSPTPQAPLGFRLIPKLFFRVNLRRHTQPRTSQLRLTIPTTSPTRMGTSRFITPRLRPHRCQRRIAKVSMALLRAKFVTSLLNSISRFKYTRSFSDGAGAATGFSPDPFKKPNGAAFSSSWHQCANRKSV